MSDNLKEYERSEEEGKPEEEEKPSWMDSFNLKEYKRSEEEEKQLGQSEAGRFDVGKNRHDLIPAWVIDELAKVYTYGANKYDDNNWWKGMKWSKVIGPLKRHLNKWRRGRIIDDESNCYHLAMVIWNAIALMCYQKNGLGKDDRCPYDLDLMDEDQRRKRIIDWKHYVTNCKDDDYNGIESDKERNVM